MVKCGNSEDIVNGICQIATDNSTQSRSTRTTTFSPQLLFSHPPLEISPITTRFKNGQPTAICRDLCPLSDPGYQKMQRMPWSCRVRQGDPRAYIPLQLSLSGTALGRTQGQMQAAAGPQISFKGCHTPSSNTVSNPSTRSYIPIRNCPY